VKLSCTLNPTYAKICNTNQAKGRQKEGLTALQGKTTNILSSFTCGAFATFLPKKLKIPLDDVSDKNFGGNCIVVHESARNVQLKMEDWE